jgi:hypothetical protein
MPRVRTAERIGVALVGRGDVDRRHDGARRRLDPAERLCRERRCARRSPVRADPSPAVWPK